MNTLARHHFTIEQYNQMIDAGVFAEDEPVEFINGEILTKMPRGKTHMAVVKRLHHTLMQVVGQRALVSVQDPVVIDNSEPEPDIALLRTREDFYASDKPTSDDVLLLIEVADSSLEFDREVKLPIYAKANIADYWIVNLNDQCLEVHRSPQSSGGYAETTTLQAADTVRPLSFPDIALSLRDVFGQ